MESLHYLAKHYYSLSLCVSVNVADIGYDVLSIYGSIARILQVKYANGLIGACSLASCPDSEEEHSEQASVRKLPWGALELDAEAWKELKVVFVNEAAAKSCSIFELSAPTCLACAQLCSSLSFPVYLSSDAIFLMLIIIEKLAQEWLLKAGFFLSWWQATCSHDAHVAWLCQNLSFQGH